MPEGLQELRVELLEVEELLPDSAAAAAAAVVAAAEAAGSTVGWAGGLTFALALPGESESDYWPWTPLAVASCGWEKQS